MQTLVLLLRAFAVDEVKTVTTSALKHLKVPDRNAPPSFLKTKSRTARETSACLGRHRSEHFYKFFVW